MDEHEMMAYELEMILHRTQNTAAMVPAYSQALDSSIRNHRRLSKTYQPPTNSPEEQNGAG